MPSASNVPLSTQKTAVSLPRRCRRPKNMGKDMAPNERKAPYMEVTNPLSSSLTELATKVFMVAKIVPAPKPATFTKKTKSHKEKSKEAPAKQTAIRPMPTR